jgi:SAM-dependent methyltransferase
MSVFNEYARYYDLLYRDKDYAGETEYVHGLIQTHAPGARSILSLGCGSGRHDRELVKRGYRGTGVDLSEEMLSAAHRGAEGSQHLAYHHGDIRTVRLDETYDVVVSLFHAMSYQNTNEDLLAAFKTARCHLKPGGIFIFDCWYGPGVLTDRPTVRVKELEDDLIKVTRIAEPVMHPNENVVDVNYHVFIQEKQTGVVYEIRESHRMRYLFLTEVQQMLNIGGFSLMISEEWLTAVRLSFTSWSAVFVCKKSDNGGEC